MEIQELEKRLLRVEILLDRDIKELNEKITELIALSKNQSKIEERLTSIDEKLKKMESRLEDLDRLREKIVSLELRVSNIEEREKGTGTKIWEIARIIISILIGLVIGKFTEKT